MTEITTLLPKQIAFSVWWMLRGSPAVLGLATVTEQHRHAARRYIMPPDATIAAMLAHGRSG